MSAIEIIKIVVLAILAGGLGYAIYLIQSFFTNWRATQDRNSRDICRHISDLRQDTVSVIKALNIQINQAVVECKKSCDDISAQIQDFHNLTATIFEQKTIELKGCIIDLGKIVDNNSDIQNKATDAWKKFYESLNATIKNELKVLRQHVDQLENNRRDLLNTLNNKQKEQLDKEFTLLKKNVKDLGYSMSYMDKTWQSYIEMVSPLESTLNQTIELLNRVKALDESIKLQEQELKKTVKEHVSTQETSLNSLVEKHVNIAQMTSELNQTSKDVFELLKLRLITSIIDETRFRPSKNAKRKLLLKCHVEKSLPAGYCLALSGECNYLGNWNHKTSLIMNDIGNGDWSIELDYDRIPKFPMSYKYMIIDSTGNYTKWESRSGKRTLRQMSIKEDEIFVLEDNIVKF